MDHLKVAYVAYLGKSRPPALETAVWAFQTDSSVKQLNLTTVLITFSNYRAHSVGDTGQNLSGTTLSMKALYDTAVIEVFQIWTREEKSTRYMLNNWALYSDILSTRTNRMAVNQTNLAKITFGQNWTSLYCTARCSTLGNTLPLTLDTFIGIN